MALDALTIQFENASFTASPGFFYRVDASAGPVTVTLPLASTTDGTAWNIIKKVDSSANAVTIVPTSPDQINQATSNVLTSQNQSHQVFPNTPTGGNLLLSIASAAGTDPFGNAYQRGFTSYGLSRESLYANLIAGALTFNDTVNDPVAPATIGLSTLNTLQDSLALEGPQQVLGQIPAQILIAAAAAGLNRGTVNIQNGALVATAGTPAVPSLITTDSWNPFSLQNGFAAGTDINGTSYPPAYMLTPTGDVKLRGELITPGTGTVTGVTFGVVPATYEPAANIPTATVANNTGGQVGVVYIRPNGNVQLAGAFGNSASIRLDCTINVQGT